MLGLQHPARRPSPLRDGEQIVTCVLTAAAVANPICSISPACWGRRPPAVQQLRAQGRVIGQLQVRLSGPLAASALAQDGWVADSILTHPLQTAETTAS
jgi:D-methionine transport system ATP-binding protein